jgi:hypothetical protein
VRGAPRCSHHYYDIVRMKWQVNKSEKVFIFGGA